MHPFSLLAGSGSASLAQTGIPSAARERFPLLGCGAFVAPREVISPVRSPNGHMMLSSDLKLGFAVDQAYGQTLNQPASAAMATGIANAGYCVVDRNG
jgi:hypothetical protein